MFYNDYICIKKNMRHIVIGDIHGRDIWKQIVELHPKDLIVFIGDYFDSFDISPVIQVQNFKEIVQFKEENKDRVILLVGNHDFHYLTGICSGEQYSGYQRVNHFDYNILLEDSINNGYLQMCYKYSNFLFTHAGVSQVWCNDIGLTIDENIDNNINEYFNKNRKHFCFYTNSNDNHGENVHQSPIWIRPKSLKKSAVNDYIHVVGHTQVEKSIIRYYLHYKNIIMVDALHNKEYLIIDENGDITTNYINTKL